MTARELPQVSEGVTSGDRVAGLKALRDRLAADIDRTVSARDIPPLVTRLTDVLAQLDELAPETAARKTTLDELAAKRRAAGLPLPQSAPDANSS
jgi:hypothetical protein